MNENLDLVEILKDCLVGTKLYSSVYGEVELENVKDNTDYPIDVKIDELSTDSFTADGKLFKEYDGECVLFPSEDQRDWSKFKPKQTKKTDKEYIINVWHDASEEPRYNEFMLGEDSDGFGIYKWVRQEDRWQSLVAITELTRWAYIKDLLPEGGED